MSNDFFILLNSLTLQIVVLILDDACVIISSMVPLKIKLPLSSIKTLSLYSSMSSIICVDIIVILFLEITER
ncbi:Uncharacterised protein [Clostridium perfringens]|uniref:Uncharacterized protein n=1 Tax=Clostridium perfringens TaxID=1502 RepID=A0A2X3IQ62_CLOPF|nr:Uncharacterised protein [Clostridium perfringens]